MQGLFMIHFLGSSILLTLLTLLIIGAKKLLQKHLTPGSNYAIGLLVILMLCLPFVPQEFVPRNGLVKEATAYQQVTKTNSEALDEGNGQDFVNTEMQEYAQRLDRTLLYRLNALLKSVWLVGIGVYLLRLCWAMRSMYALRSNTALIDSSEIQQVFVACKKELHITRSIRLQQSSLVRSPMALGIFRPIIVLPNFVVAQLSVEEIRYILLHELIHYKHFDLILNYIMIFFKGIYWFNPLLHWAFQKMREDCELRCDSSVLGHLEPKKYIAYGKTMLHFVELRNTYTKHTLATCMGGNKKQLRKRIENIASFRHVTTCIRYKSVVILLGISALIGSQATAISAVPYANKSDSLQGEKVQYEDLSDFFDGFEGSFVLYDNSQDSYTIYNEKQSIKRVAPNSTYKIYSALIALETGVLVPGQTMRQWNGTPYIYTTWEQDQSLESAMKNSVNWYFQQLDAQVGREKIATYLEDISYGNGVVSGALDSFWIEGTLKISPMEQVQLLQKLYNKELPFQAASMELVKNALTLEQQGTSVFAGKTGTGNINGKDVNGWFVGYVEQGEYTYLFATNIQGDTQATGSTALAITQAILANKGIYPAS